jgi:hypothetical protein
MFLKVVVPKFHVFAELATEACAKAIPFVVPSSAPAAAMAAASQYLRFVLSYEDSADIYRQSSAAKDTNNYQGHCHQYKSASFSVRNVYICNGKHPDQTTTDRHLPKSVSHLRDGVV